MSRFDEEYTLDWAKGVAKDVKRIEAMVGAQATYPYLPYQFAAALRILYDNLVVAHNNDKAALELKTRQYNALNARYVKLAKKHNEPFAAELSEDSGS
jgi:hypothetical protein